MNGKILMILIGSMVLLLGIGAACAEQFDSADDAVALEQDEVAVAPEGDAVAQENEAVEIECDGDVADEAPAVDDKIVADKDASDVLSAADDAKVVSGVDCHALGIGTGSNVIKSFTVKDVKQTKSLYKYVGYGVKSHSKWKIITTKAKKHWITKKSGKFKVKTKIYDMTAGFRAPYKCIDIFLYKNGKMVQNTKYKVKYKINGKWTGWKKYGIIETSHHRHYVYDSAKVQKIKVKCKRNVKSFLPYY